MEWVEGGGGGGVFRAARGLEKGGEGGIFIGEEGGRKGFGEEIEGQLMFSYSQTLHPHTPL